MQMVKTQHVSSAMKITDIDRVKLSRLTSEQIDLTTCLECCKYFIAPQTAACGHTLCHSCWIGRRTCLTCSKPFERENLKHNLPLQTLTEHVHALSDAFEKLFNINLNDFLVHSDEIELEGNPTKNVNDWLESSQNHFSAPAQSFEQFSQDRPLECNPLDVSHNKIQIHNNTEKTSRSPEAVVHISIPQDDWDKIETMPDTDTNKNKENVVGPMDIEPMDIHDNEYTVNNPRRSSRKRDLKPICDNKKANDNKSIEKHSSRDSSGETDKKSNKTKQNWNSVKRMRKEFSKLNKINRNKLNVSIEMCKKTQNTAKANIKLPQAVYPQGYDIDENTPDQLNINKAIIKEVTPTIEELKEHETEINQSNVSQNSHINHGKNNVNEITEITGDLDKHEITKHNNNPIQQSNNQVGNMSQYQKNTLNITETEKVVKMPFYKKSAFYQDYCQANTIKTINHNINSNTTSNEDIEITIKVGNCITNIIIKKNNDVELKLNTDQETQTSLGLQDHANKIGLSQITKTQDIALNIEGNQKVDINQSPVTDPKLTELRTVNKLVNTIPVKKNIEVKFMESNTTSVHATSRKKNTDSADTTTAQFEITESVEKELSKIMDCEEAEEQAHCKSTSVAENNNSKENKTKKPELHPDDIEYLNDLDIFDSESVKESNVHLLKNTDHIHSEILVCTVQTKNKTQNHSEKRDRDVNDEGVLPKCKKAKLNDDNDKGVVENETIEPQHNQSESEPLNYDSIMGKVFASIDADMEGIRESQNIDNNTHKFHDDHNKTLKNKDVLKDIALSTSHDFNSSLNEYCNQKESENIFSVRVDKEHENINCTPTNEKVPVLSDASIDDFLTPVMCNNIQPINEDMAGDNDIEILNEDSDKSVVEETPQKTSFSKLKHKSDGSNKELNQSQRMRSVEQKMLSEKKSSESVKLTTDSISVVNLSDTYVGMKSKDVTVIETVNKKHTLETPLNIKKFVDQIKHKSTPVARKSLNFTTQEMDEHDPEQTLCPTNDIIAKTTQEKEFMSKAFEKSPITPAARPLGMTNLALTRKRVCIAGSCLSASEVTKLKHLCSRNKWTYSDKYSKDLTHLVVGVDENNRSQRSVKYMCALASSKWILSYEWVENYLQSKNVVAEEYYEALDSTGEPGPRRSRMAAKKLFQGFTFFCMEPFSVLDVDTLKGMLEAAGGKVVKEAKDVKVTDERSAPAILLAEPENTQEDRFTYLAMELSIVPVNFEWVLNCLGSYTLRSLHDLLLCPSMLLPKATKNWPQELLAQDED